MLKNKKYTPKVRVWINKGDNCFLGIGRVILLEKIKETGSITNAAKSIQMSYRQAWQLIEDINKHAKTPLVTKTLGGKSGSGATLTKAGEDAVKEFYKIDNKIKLYAKKLSTKIKF